MKGFLSVRRGLESVPAHFEDVLLGIVRDNFVDHVLLWWVGFD